MKSQPLIVQIGITLIFACIAIVAVEGLCHRWVSKLLQIR